MPRPARLFLALPLLLWGCAPPPLVAPSPPASIQDLSGCGGNALAQLLGQPVSALPAGGTWGALRVVHPGDAVTQDYAPARLNVLLDGRDRISALSCG